MIVCKFGGSSLTSLMCLQLIRKIIKSNGERKIIVVSAVGKQSTSDCKITDLLIDAYKANDRIRRQSILDTVKNKLLRLIDDNSFKKNFIDNYLNFCENVMNYSFEYTVSRGENFTAQAVAHYLNFRFLDSKDFLLFNDKGKIDVDISRKKLLTYDYKCGIVIPGFYGVDQNGEIKLFERGGGDVSASYVANFVKAEKYENYTDVGGVFNADPKRYGNAKNIKFLSYSQCYKMSILGANVVASRSILPIVKKQIPLEIIDLKTQNKTLIHNKTARKLNYVSTPKTIKKTHFKFSKKEIKNGIIFEILKLFTSNEIKIYYVLLFGDEMIVYSETFCNFIKNALLKIKKINSEKTCFIDIFSFKTKLKKLIKQYNLAKKDFCFNYNYTRLKIFSDDFSDEEINSLLTKI